ncbi:MAG: hypothetical protein WA040_00755 [Anaerolineae bacterium]
MASNAASARRAWPPGSPSCSSRTYTTSSAVPDTVPAVLPGRSIATALASRQLET